MRPWVYGNSFRWLSNFADAEDATQKTFMHLAMNWQRLEFDDWPELREYLKRTSSSRCIDLLRKRRRADVDVDSVDFALESVPSSSASYDPQSVDQLIEHLDLSADRIVSISARQKQVLWLAYLGHSNAEIASNIGISDRSVRRDLLAVRRWIR
jgi:RNA polymerase sigma factor (sigma-70 family)